MTNTRTASTPSSGATRYRRPTARELLAEAGHVAEDLPVFRTRNRANEWLLLSKTDSTWARSLIPTGDGRTRLVTRIRASYDWSIRWRA